MFGGIIALGATGVRDTTLMFLNQTPFNIVDPLFSKDISFFVFTLPFCLLI
ncbi:MAG: COG1615 family transporter [Elusimicrobia bacterium]|nr:COG1615 family transporter [Elusimicrobiota bacterium]